MATTRTRAWTRTSASALLRGYLPGRLLEAGLIARPDDRGDAVLHIAPPLISDAGVIDELVGKLGEVLTDAHDVLHGRT